ncbi:MAG TPA: hypothetical protein VKX17_14375, partial [Planctomycetota bacterium]|nr:hypothetical protein [Planctomycetota bacterium]
PLPQGERGTGGRSAAAPMVGMTLVEILTALFVLSIGLAGVLSITIRSSQMGAIAADRNNASVIMPEAIKDIEHMLLVDSNAAAQVGASHLGELMDTVDLGAGTNPFANYVFYSTSNPTGGTAPFTYSNLTYPTPTVDNVTGRNLYLAYWPMNMWYSRVMGQFPNAGPEKLLNNTGIAYRGLFKLEPHPEWVPDPSVRGPNREIPDSAFAGVYVLTLTMYRDLDPGKLTTDATKRLQQVSDPVVVYLRDKKVR